jgi:hypothetical protein
VPPGQHAVVFQYVAYPHYLLLLEIGAGTFVLLALAPWLWRRLGRRIARRGVVLRGRKAQ